MVKNPKFEIFPGSSGQYYFRLRAKNGQVILSSQGYSSKQGCEKGIASVKSCAADESCYVQKTAANGDLYFNLLAKNGQVIGKSQMYKTAKGRNNGIASVAANAPQAGIDTV